MAQTPQLSTRGKILQRIGIPDGLITLALTRLTINTGYRLVYPFLPVFARSLGISLQSAANIVSLRSFVGIFGPALGSLVDILDRKTAMFIGTSLAIFGFLATSIVPTMSGFIIGLLLIAAAKAIFDPAVLAYLGDHISYERRGRAIAISEFSWSTASLIGIPLVGMLIAAGTWRTPWPILAAAVLLLTFLIYRNVDTKKRQVQSQKLTKVLSELLSRPGIAAAMVFTFLICVSNQIIYVVYGAWMEDSFGLSIAQIGAATMVLGAAEVMGEGGVALITDRIGKQLAVVLGITVSILGAVCIIFLQYGLLGSLIGLFLFYIGFEFALVSLFPMITEMVPLARGTAAAVVIASLELGHAIGAVLAPGLYYLGLNTSLVLSIGLNLIALLIFQLGVRRLFIQNVSPVQGD
ncbi:MAG: MFS transporter [Anaerolineales bacterium]|nr:MFS transporter [Anaerolineales bacterium]